MGADLVLVRVCTAHVAGAQGQQSWALRPGVRVQARERVSQTPHCPVIFTRRAMSQRHRRHVQGRHQGGAGRSCHCRKEGVRGRVVYNHTVRNGTGSRLGTSPETAELKTHSRTVDPSDTVTSGEQLPEVVLGAVLGPGIPGLGS